MKIWMKLAAVATQAALAVHEPYLAGIFFTSFVWAFAEQIVSEKNHD